MSIQHFTAKTATANYIRTVNSIDLEFTTVTGYQVIVSLPAGIETQLLDGDKDKGSLEDACLEANYHRDRGAAGPWDRGRAA